MNQAVTPTTERAIVLQARRSQRIECGALDQLLALPGRTPASLRRLARALRGVRLVQGAVPDDLFEHRLASLPPGPQGGDELTEYAERLRALPRLSREQETRLARRLELARYRLEEELHSLDLSDELMEAVVSSASITGLDSEAALATTGVQDQAELRHVCREYAELRAHFVERNLYIAVSMSAAYRSYGLPAMDLIQEANAFLIRAVEKYEWRKGFRFQTYAAFWVRQAIERYITANRGLVRIPNHVQQKLRRLRREGKLTRNPREMDHREVAQLFDSSHEEAARLMASERSWRSLDAVPGEGEASFGSTLAAREENASAELSPSERLLLAERLDEALGEHLTDTERKLLSQRFGLKGFTPQTLEQLGDQRHMSRERIRLLQVKALGKLRTGGLRESLADFL
ncbi:MAG: sigma-70 family RNA polymerase sigma factor [Planctomycetota bacterium]